MNITHAMLLIKSIDQHACLKLSDIPLKWYVASNIKIDDGELIFTIYQYRATPIDAVYAFLAYLQNIPRSSVIITNSLTNARNYWRWNGAAFIQEPAENFIS